MSSFLYTGVTIDMAWVYKNVDYNLLPCPKFKFTS